MIAIGDIHGCRTSLEQLLTRLVYNADDTLVFIGDYVDRGPDTPGTIELLIKLSRSHPNCVFLRGNHDSLLLDFTSGNPELFNTGYLSPGIGGQTTASQYGMTDEELADCLYNDFRPSPALLNRCTKLLPPAHREFLKKTRFMYVTDEYLFVHAGIDPGKSLAEQNPYDIIWIRDDFINVKHSLPQTIIYGHTPTVRFGKPEPRWDLKNRKIGIDTGAVWGGLLTALQLPEMKVTSVPGYSGWKR